MVKHAILASFLGGFFLMPATPAQAFDGQAFPVRMTGILCDLLQGAGCTRGLVDFFADGTAIAFGDNGTWTYDSNNQVVSGEVTSGPYAGFTYSADWSAPCLENGEVVAFGFLTVASFRICDNPRD